MLGKQRISSSLIGFLLAACSPLLCAQATSHGLGQFTAQGDIGEVLHPGSASYEATQGIYSITGSGENTWFRSDQLHLVWQQMTGDADLSAEIEFPVKGGNAHRKAMLMFRQSLAPDSAYIDIARHGDGLTSLQYRGATGEITREIQTRQSGPRRVRLVKRGDFFYVFYAGEVGDWKYSGAAMKLPLHGAFYVGIGVCSHDNQVLEKVIFSHVKLSNAARPEGSSTLYSTLETVPIASGDRRVATVTATHFEAPNWLGDNSGFLVNEGGSLRIFRTGSDAFEQVSIAGESLSCNNDHAPSPDGRHIAFSASATGSGSRVYTVPVTGGKPARITDNEPSYFHGWSPDGRTLAFTGQRKGEFDIYTIPAAGGPETRLTSAAGLDDGPEYSPDGEHIYFNSERSGHMQIWRMHPDGTGQEQVSHTSTNDWFPHISPDGRWMVYMAYAPGVIGHPPNKDVTLQLMSLETQKVTLLAELFGGQGTINVPSWSPDSTHIAFVSYALVPELGGEQ